jgi:hypothetical protein
MNMYIANKGKTQTVIYDNNGKHVNQLGWKADYNGENANILLDNTTDGKKSKVFIQLDNNDIAELFAVPSVNKPLDQRLSADFKRKKTTPYLIETNDSVLKPNIIHENMLTHLSSPQQNEELLIPMSLNYQDKYKTPSNRNKRTKRNKLTKRKKTHRVYKRIRRTI